MFMVSFNISLLFIMEEIMRRKVLGVLLSVFVLASALCCGVSADTTYYTVDITNTAATVYEGNRLDVVITVSDIAAGTMLTSLSFRLNYDSACVTPSYTQTVPNDTACIVSTPASSAWEQIVSQKTGYYDCFFMPADGGWSGTAPTSSVISQSGTLTVTLAFTVNAGAAGSTAIFGVSDIVAYDATDSTLSTTVAGAASSYSAAVSEPLLPVTTLGAAINTVSPALRLGARYETAYLASGVAATDVSDLGMVFYPTRLLGENELNISTSGSMHRSAQGIANYDSTKVFSDYTTITFYVTIVGIPYNGLDDEISFRAYCTYGETTIYSDTMSRSYDYVYDTLYPGLATGVGDTVIYAPTGWWS